MLTNADSDNSEDKCHDGSKSSSNDDDDNNNNKKENSNSNNDGDKQNSGMFQQVLAVCGTYLALLTWLVHERHNRDMWSHQPVSCP